MSIVAILLPDFALVTLGWLLYRIARILAVQIIAAAVMLPLWLYVIGL